MITQVRARIARPALELPCRACACVYWQLWLLVPSVVVAMEVWEVVACRSAMDVSACTGSCGYLMYSTV